MRRTSTWVIAAMLMTGVVGVGIGANEKPASLPPIEAPTPPVVATKVDPKVAQLIADLGSDDYRAREKAGRDLATLGEKALPGMKSAMLSTESPEVQRRLAVLVRKMEIDRLISPKRVTLAVKQKSVKDTLEEISKQTGYKIEYGGNTGVGEPRHDFEFDNAPFWVAIDKVAAASGCVVFAEYDDETIRVYNQDTINPHVAYAGPFRFLATNIHSNKSVQLSGINRRGGGANRHENMSLQFQIQSEPKNPMLGVTQAEVISAVDENGNSLLPPKDPNNRQSYYENRGMRGHNTYGNVNLNRTGGGASATTIKSLKGKIGIILLSGVTPEIAITDPLKIKSKTFVGRTVEMDFGTLVEDANAKGTYVLDVTLKKLGANDDNQQDYNWSNSAWSKLELFDAAGNKYQTYGPNNINNNGSSVQITLPFNTNDRRTGKPIKLGPPVKLVVNEWLSVTHEVTFEFKDLPLP
ncbi:MAG: hypothetical protein C0467_02880 [Planctomycetaceae bacterium]|nr:hypothetical protein [Planctomycetaceae bacterium]